MRREQCRELRLYRGEEQQRRAEQTDEVLPQRVAVRGEAQAAAQGGEQRALEHGVVRRGRGLRRGAADEERDGVRRRVLESNVVELRVVNCMGEDGQRDALQSCTLAIVVQAMALLQKRRPSFNFASNLLQSLARRVDSPVPAIADMALAALRETIEESRSGSRIRTFLNKILL